MSVAAVQHLGLVSYIIALTNLTAYEYIMVDLKAPANIYLAYCYCACMQILLR